MKNTSSTLSVVVPFYNEAAGLEQFHKLLTAVLKDAPLQYEIIYVDDGSLDKGLELVRSFCEDDKHVRLIKFSRNFGKELATTAGIHAAQGDAIIIIDADGQHPVDAIPQFVKKWQQGAKVVVGLPTDRKASFVKRTGSKLFYGAFRRMTGIVVESDATDFRLIDRSVQIEFNRLTEHNRLMRALVDWLGYEQHYVRYKENARLAGASPYSFRKLFKLAIDSAISLSTSPLYMVAYLGGIVLPVSTLLGIGMLVNYVLSDPLHLHATGGAYVMVLILFLIGVLMVSQGIIGLYLSHIHSETQNRPLYIIDTEQSKGL